MRVKEKNGKAGLKLSIKKWRVASGPITSWQMDGEKMETVKDFLFVGSKILLNIRDITLLAKVHILKAMVFPVVMYRCESWTIK